MKNTFMGLVFLIFLSALLGADVSLLPGNLDSMKITTIYRYARGYQAPLTISPFNLHYTGKGKYHLSPLHRMKLKRTTG